MFFRPITEISSVIFTIIHVIFEITEIPSVIYHPQFKVINPKLGYKKKTTSRESRK